MILLDTCTLLWLVNNRKELSAAATVAIDRADEVFVSAASAFEIGVKHGHGRLDLARAPREWWRQAVARLRLLELAITPMIAFAATALPTTLTVAGKSIVHKDPGDRFLVATAALNGLTVVTPDECIAAYPGVAVLW